jgi:tetratricopeptide (TPR) repeat protein
MTVRRHLLALAALLALALAAGCGGGDSVPLAAETDEPLYLQGLQLKRQGKHPEALVSFLKVIEKRGDQSSAESHLEVGLICLTQMKDFVEAIHHFQAYLAQKPNSLQAPGVRDLVNSAKREYLKSLLGRAPDEITVRPPEGSMEFEQLRKENEELRAELATLRGGGTAPVRATGRGLLTFDPNGNAARGTTRTAPPPAEDSPLQLTTTRASTSSRPLLATPPIPTTARGPTTGRATTAATPAPIPAGRRYRVAAGDSLFSIARKYDPVNTNAKVRAIVDANPEAFPGGNFNTPLKQGAELRIP